MRPWLPCVLAAVVNFGVFLVLGWRGWGNLAIVPVLLFMAWIVRKTPK